MAIRHSKSTVEVGCSIESYRSRCTSALGGSIRVLTISSIFVRFFNWINFSGSEFLLKLLLPFFQSSSPHALMNAAMMEERVILHQQSPARRANYGKTPIYWLKNSTDHLKEVIRVSWSQYKSKRHPIVYSILLLNSSILSLSSHSSFILLTLLTIVWSGVPTGIQ